MSAYNSQISLRSILRHIQKHTGNDLSHYQDSLIKQRIKRRMYQLSHETLQTYHDYMKGSAEECLILQNDILSSVTDFFRNPKAFTVFKHHLYERLAQHPIDQELRCWVVLQGKKLILLQC